MKSLDQRQKDFLKKRIKSLVKWSLSSLHFNRYDDNIIHLLFSVINSQNKFPYNHKHAELLIVNDDTSNVVDDKYFKDSIAVYKIYLLYNFCWYNQFYDIKRYIENKIESTLFKKV